MLEKVCIMRWDSELEDGVFTIVWCSGVVTGPNMLTTNQYILSLVQFKTVLISCDAVCAIKLLKKENTLPYSHAVHFKGTFAFAHHPLVIYLCVLEFQCGRHCLSLYCLDKQTGPSTSLEY